jgi:hypothetical protein
MMRHHSDLSRGRGAVESLRFWAMFGVRSANICSHLWDKQVRSEQFHNGQRGKSWHLLWALMLLKLYATEATLCALAGGVDKKAFCKWSWRFVVAIAELTPDVVSKH